MKSFFSIAVTVLVHRMRMLLADRLFLPVLVLIPLLLSAITSAATVREMKQGIAIRLVLESQDASAAALALAIEGVQGLDVERTSEVEAERQVRARQAEAALILPEDFPEQGNPTLVISPYSRSGTFIRERIAAEIMAAAAPGFVRSWVSESLGEEVSETEALSAWSDIRKNGDRMKIRFVTLRPMDSATSGTAGATAEDAAGGDSTAGAPDSDPPAVSPSADPTAGAAGVEPLSSSVSAGYGLLVLFLFFSCLHGSGWLAAEKSNGTFDRMRAAGAAGLPLLAGNLLSVAATGGLSAALYLAVAVPILHAPMLPSAWTVGVLAAYLFAVSSVSMLIAGLFPDRRSLQAAAPAIAVLSGFAGGCLWNRPDLPAAIKRISLATPQGWALRGLEEAASVAGVTLAVQAAFVLVVLGAAACLVVLVLPERGSR